MFGDVYRGRRVLLTGHTGFKGSWLALWLRELGANVTGLALPPSTQRSHWDLLELPMAGLTCDIRDRDRVARAVRDVRPEFVFHLAAQALVRPSYEDPTATWDTNVIGTVNVLEACRQSGGVQAIVVVTSDKCYDNRETERPYREEDPLGGHDPYSASKAATELVAGSYRRSFFSTPGAPRLATARAGNVLGGGDWSRDRLVPDVVRGVESGTRARIRHPEATRPWQHVLEPLSGYLLLGQRLLADTGACSAWNFGPDEETSVSVASVLEGMHRHWPELAWDVHPDSSRHEATLLHVDSHKARKALGWAPVWNLDRTLAAAARWYADFLIHGQVRSVEQLHCYTEDALRMGLVWARA